MVAVVGLPLEAAAPPRGSGGRSLGVAAWPRRSRRAAAGATPPRARSSGSSGSRRRARTARSYRVSGVDGSTRRAPGRRFRRPLRRRSRRRSWSGRTSRRSPPCRRHRWTRRGLAPRPRRLPPGARRPGDGRQLGDVGWASVEMDRDDRPGAFGQRGGCTRRIDQGREFVDVDRHRSGPGRTHRRHGRHRGEGRHDHLVAGADAERAHDELDRRGAARHADEIAAPSVAAPSVSKAASSGPSSSVPDRITRLTATR